MSLIKKYGALLFLAILIAHCVCIYFEWGTLRTITKLLLLPVLIAYLWVHTGNRLHSLQFQVYAGLIFSFLGDLLLARPGEQFFLLGMLAFIGTHVCNSIYFYRLQPLRFSRAKEAWLALIVLLVVTVVVFGALNPYLGKFKLPILVYMLIISIMGILATNTVSNPTLKSLAVQYFIPGAALFVFSDGVLAMNKFYYHKPFVDIIVMLSYGYAQFLLVLGFREKWSPSRK
jgi:uncharacterized membrane protein YhhN